MKNSSFLKMCILLLWRNACHNIVVQVNLEVYEAPKLRLDLYFWTRESVLFCETCNLFVWSKIFKIRSIENQIRWYASRFSFISSHISKFVKFKGAMWWKWIEVVRILVIICNFCLFVRFDARLASGHLIYLFASLE